jgi:hypothetical protein
MAFFCVSQQGEFKNTITNFLEKIHVTKILQKNNPVIFFLRLFLIAFFGRFSA